MPASSAPASATAPALRGELTLIAGCGYLGKEIASQLRKAGREVLCLTHSPASAAALRAEGWEARDCDLTDPAACLALAETDILAGAGDGLRVIHCAASGRGGGPEQYRAVYVEGAKNLRRAFPEARFFLTSSSSVYAQIDGSEITEASPATPPRETGRLLRQAEEETLAAGGIVGRLAGIYGPGRSVLLRNFLEGKSAIDVREEPPRTPDGRWINQIHAADAAAAILHLLDLPAEALDEGAKAWAGTPGARLFNISDSTPFLQRELYSRLSARFGLPLPPEAPPDTGRKRGWTHKRVSNRALLATGWRPRFPDWFTTLEQDPEFLPSILSQTTAPASA